MVQPNSLKILAIALKIAEGRRKEIVDLIAKQVELQPGIALLDLRRLSEVNSTIIKFAGEVTAILNSLFPICQTAYQNLNYSASDNHVRVVGAISSIVFIPIRGIELDECKSLVTSFSADFSEKYQQPLFYFGPMAEPENAGLNDKFHSMTDREIQIEFENQTLIPDLGRQVYNPERGITLIGIRKFIATFILYLDTGNLDIAEEISDQISGLGKKYYDENNIAMTDENGELIRDAGMYPEIDAMAMGTSSDQVSRIVCNIRDYENPTLVELFRNVQLVAEKYFVQVLGSTLIGYLPMQIFEAAFRKLPEAEELENKPFLDRLNFLIEYLGMNSFGEFNPQWQIIDFRFIPYPPLA